MARIGTIQDIYSSETWEALEKLKKNETNPYGEYKPSDTVNSAFGNYQQALNSKPGKYQSKYSEQISTLLSDILNQKEFKYDFNADPLYHEYKDQYTNLGKQAMMDTAANAATLTGGYGNSYAVTAAAQANQQYLQQLNGVIPELYSLALDKYKMDTDRKLGMYQALGSQEDREFSQYNTNYQNWQNDTANALQAYDTLYGQDFSKYQQNVLNWQADRGYYNDRYNGSVSNDQYVSNYNQAEEEYEREQQRWQAEFLLKQQQFEYQKQQDAAAYALSLARSRSSGGSSSGGSSTQAASASGNLNAMTNYVGREDTAPAGLTPSHAGTEQQFNTVKNMASWMKNSSADKDAYKRYLTEEVNKGTISMGQASQILQSLG